MCKAEFTPYLRNGIAISKYCQECRNIQEKQRKKNKPKKKLKPKRTRLRILDDKLWKLFSIYTRSKDTDFAGNVCCYTCGSVHHWRTVDAGHFIKRGFKKSKFDERNVKPQCKKCNQFGGGMQDEFAVNILNNYGADVLLELHASKNEIFKPTEEWYNEKIIYYKNKISEL